MLHALDCNIYYAMSCTHATQLRIRELLEISEADLEAFLVR